MQSDIRITSIAHTSGNFCGNQRHSELLSVCLSQTFHQTCRHFKWFSSYGNVFLFVRLVVAVAREATCLEGVCTGTGGWGGLECSSQGVTILLVLSVAYSPLHTAYRNGGILDRVCTVRSTVLFFSLFLSKNLKCREF